MAENAAGSGIPSWLTAYLEAWNSHDPAQVVACVTDDVVFDDKGLGERFEGTDAMRDMLVDMTESFSSDFRLEAGDLLFATGDMWAAEWVMTGTNDREDRTHGLPNTGRSFRIQGLSIGRVRDGKVSEEHLYWNMADYLQQVGLMPEAPQPATA
ncbi:ester cyclase [Geodermatophilus sp. URMC 64]